MIKKLFLILLILGALMVPALSSPVNFTAWAAYGDAWKCNNDTFTLVKWNSTTSIHYWLSTGNATTIKQIVLIGGGAGGSGFNTGLGGYGGGGGSGAMAEAFDKIVSGLIAIGVGKGGIGGGSLSDGTAGFESNFSDIHALGGGYGSYYSGSTPGRNGGSGGSGGGGSANVGALGGSANNASSGGATVYGNPGGNSGNNGGGGGGGAGAGGSPGGSVEAGRGGLGRSNSITGNAVIYATGGNASNSTFPATSGLGGRNEFGEGGDSQKNGAGAGTGGGNGAVIILYSNLPSPSVSFTAVPTSAYLGQIHQFNDSSLNFPTSWNYSFGDGNFSTSQNPVYQYPNAGTYNVNLTACNAIGCSYLLKSAYITIFNNSAGHIDDYVKIAPPAQIKEIKMDPLIYDLTPPKGEVIWNVAILIPVDSRGTLTVHQRDGKISTGSWNYSKLGIFGHFSITFGSSSSEYDYQSVVGVDRGILEADPVIVELFNSKNESGKSPGLSIGYGQLPGLYNHVLSIPTNPEPMDHFSFNSDKNIVVTWWASPTQSAITTLLHLAQANDIPILGDALQIGSDLKALALIIFYWAVFFLITFQLGTFLLYSFGMALYSATRCNGQDMLCWWKLFLEAEANYITFWMNIIYSLIQALLKWL